MQPLLKPFTIKPVAALAGTLCLFGLLSSATHAAPPKVPTSAAAASSTHGGTLAQWDFTAPNTWPQKAVSTPAQNATLTQTAAGTVDIAASTQASGGLLFNATKLTSNAPAGFASGKLPVVNHEASLGKLTLAFSLSASSTRPVIVLVDSFNAAKRRTGRLMGKVYPAAPAFYQRYALDLSSMRAYGQGAFSAHRPVRAVQLCGSGGFGPDAVPLAGGQCELCQRGVLREQDRQRCQ